MKISFLGTVMISLGLSRCLLTTSFMLYEIIPRGYPLRDKCFLRSSKADCNRRGDEQIMKISFLGTVMISLGLSRCLLTTSFMLYEIIPRGYPLRDKCFLEVI